MTLATLLAHLVPSIEVQFQDKLRGQSDTDINAHFSVRV
jgi:hypothetical protein